MSEEDIFQGVIDADLDDHTARLVFAARLEEQGDPRAAGYREMGTRHLRPYPTVDADGAPEYLWWREGPDDRPHQCALGAAWFDTMAGGATATATATEPGTWSQIFSSRREAENAAAMAYARLSVGAGA